MLYQRTERAEDAITLFREVVAKQFENVDAHSNLGLALLQMGDAKGAIAEFQRALQAQPGDAGFETNLGAAYLQLADFDSAVAHFEMALKVAPQDATLHYDLGLALKLKDKLPEVIAEMRKATLKIHVFVDTNQRRLALELFVLVILAKHN